MNTVVKYLLVSAASVLLMACTDPYDTSSSSSSSSSTSTGGTVLPYGGFSYTYTCAYSGTHSVTIPHTVSTSCVNTYKEMADRISCNDYDSATYTRIMNAYYSCMSQEASACSSASSSDPNC